MLARRNKTTTHSDRGTEGSTKRIILGTSFGEFYEYALLSPNATVSSSGKAKSSAFDTKAGELMMDDSENDPMDSPVLLRRLNAGSGAVGRSTAAASRNAGGDQGGAVGGILFQRILGGLGMKPTSAAAGGGSGGSVVVLASTGGVHRHTRLHTFRSEASPSSPSPSLRSAFSRGSGSYVELPGSVEFADLCSCSNDGTSFALRTETGIYYGTMERVIMTSIAAVSIGSGSDGSISDAGMLTYDALHSNSSSDKRFSGSSSGMITAPASIGLTPYHFITLSSTNDVKFINRVAKKVIQEERVDWVSVSQTSSAAENDLQYGGRERSSSWGGGGGLATAELLADIRRPDQIWLRKGRSLVHISSSCEDRDEWKFTLTRCIEIAGVGSHYNPATSPPAGGTDSLSATLTSEEKHIESQFEHAKSLCSNRVS